MKKVTLLVTVLLFATASFAEHPHAMAPAAEKTFAPLPGAGKKCPLTDGNYFTYKFAEKPKLGTVVLVVQVFDKTGKRINSYDVSGESDMPSMRGHHASGAVKFKLNKKGNYLLPVNVVMPGEWEVIITVSKDGTIVHQGSLKFVI